LDGTASEPSTLTAMPTKPPAIASNGHGQPGDNEQRAAPPPAQIDQRVAELLDRLTRSDKKAIADGGTTMSTPGTRCKAVWLLREIGAADSTREAERLIWELTTGGSFKLTAQGYDVI
jgi:hypothetical protein